MNLSPEMKKCLNFIKEHEKIIRYNGGFWAEENAEMKPLYNGGKNLGDIPIFYFATNTIKALLKRNLITPIKIKTNNYLERDYIVECIIKK